MAPNVSAQTQISSPQYYRIQRLKVIMVVRLLLQVLSILGVVNLTLARPQFSVKDPAPFQVDEFGTSGYPHEISGQQAFW